MAVTMLAEFVLPVADRKDGSQVKGMTETGRSLGVLPPGLMTSWDTRFGIWSLFACPQLQLNEDWPLARAYLIWEHRLWK
jgi:hypothetical protein